MTDIPVRGKAGSAITFGSNSDTVLWTIKNVGNNAGRVSAQYDLGALGTARAERWGWSMRLTAQATPTLNQRFRLYLSRWNAGGTEAEGGIGSSDAAFATEAKLLNCDYVGCAVCDAAAASTLFRASGELWIPAHIRYISVIGWNALGSAVVNVDADVQFSMWPIDPTIVV